MCSTCYTFFTLGVTVRNRHVQPHAFLGLCVMTIFVPPQPDVTAAFMAKHSFQSQVLLELHKEIPFYIFHDSDTAYHLCKKQHTMKTENDRNYINFFFLKSCLMPFHHLLGFQRYLPREAVQQEFQLWMLYCNPCVHYLFLSLQTILPHWRFGYVVIHCF